MFDQSTSELTLKECFLFPFGSRRARRDAVEGALWLLILPVGWILNHRADATAEMRVDWTT